MNCPYCATLVYGLTGLQELKHYENHLRLCRKNPNNIVLSDGKRTAVVPKRRQTLNDALTIRAESGQ